MDTAAIEAKLSTCMCGAQPRIHEDLPWDDTNHAYIECSQCQMATSVEYGVVSDASIEAWNKMSEAGRQAASLAQALETVAAQAAELARLREDVAVLHPFADFGHRMLEDWEQHGDVDAGDRFERARMSGVLKSIEGGYDPEKHYDTEGFADAGDPWYETTPPSASMIEYRSSLQQID